MRLLTLIILVSNVFCTQQAEQNSVIVIGAGPAGIAATVKLLEHGVNVTLLEAENRIGGRVFSTYFGDAVVDLGAEWCHGEGGNEVYKLVKDLDVLRHGETHFQMYTSDSGLVDEKLAYELHEIFDTIYSPGGHRVAREGETIGDFFQERYKEEINTTYPDNPKQRNISLEALDLFHRYVLSSEGAFNWHDVSAVNDYRECTGDLNLNWNGRGFRTALDVLMKKLPTPDHTFPIDEAIRLNSKVTRIMWNKLEGVSLFVADGDATYSAKQVIFTGSLGVLKDSHGKVFAPPLPKRKREVIRKLGIGAVMKVMMHFPQRFWNTDANFTGFSFVWTEKDRKALKAVYPHGPITENTHWLEDLFGVYRVEQNDKVLSAWFSGSMVPLIEKMSDDSIIDGIVFSMTKFLGGTHNKIIRPDRIARSNWYNNRNFRGTYSFQTVESRKMTNNPNFLLSQPLINKKTGKPVVFFAGEATHPYYYSTVHGAIESGYRAAAEVLKAM